MAFASPFFSSTATLSASKWTGATHPKRPRNRRPSLACRSHATRCCAQVTKESAMIVEARTMAWARVVVCGLNLCPFAEGVLDANTVRVSISPADDERTVREVVSAEISYLLRTSSNSVSTTLIVLPHFAVDDFLRFHALCNELEASVEAEDRLVDEVMLACFHPLHRWGDTEDVDDASNFDKRAPYAIINLLRAPVVDRYVEEGRTVGILERNLKTLQRLGSDKLKDLYRSLADVDVGV